MRLAVLLVVVLVALSPAARADECSELAAMLARRDMQAIPKIRALGPRAVMLTTALVPLWYEAKYSGSNDVAEEIAGALRSIGADALVARTLERPNEAWATVTALTAVGPTAAGAFRALFNDEREQILRHAAECSRDIDDKKLDASLLRLVGGTASTTRRSYAAYALVSRFEMNPEMVGRVLPSLLRDRATEVQLKALEAASGVLSPRADGDEAETVGALSGLTASSDPYVRMLAARSLGRLEVSAGDAWKVLARLVEDQAVRVRIAALVALRNVANSDAVPAVRRALDDPAVAFEAARTLVALSPDGECAPRALVLLMKYPDDGVRKSAVEQLRVRGRLDDETRRRMSDLLDDAHPMVRVCAAWVLWNDGSGWQTIGRSILEVLKDEAPWDGVTTPPALMYALELVETVGTPASAAAARLEKLVRCDGAVGEAAARALAAVRLR